MSVSIMEAGSRDGVLSGTKTGGSEGAEKLLPRRESGGAVATNKAK